MIFHINWLPALEVNGMALLQEKPMVEVVSTHFLQCFQLFLCTVRRAAIYNPWTRPLRLQKYGLVAYPLCTVLMVTL